MKKVIVQVKEDHLERLIKTATHGVCELIWNSFDADATEVDLEVELNHLGGVETLRVTDDGTGITRESAESDFGDLGGSWKARERYTKNNRQLHGRKGQGRWAAFGIGEIVQWVSFTEIESGKLSDLGVKITGRRGALGEFVIEDHPGDEETRRGTKVTVSELTSAAQKSFDRPDFADDLITPFALYLQQYQVSLYWRGQRVKPEKLQSRTHSVELNVDGVEGASLTVIEWKRQVGRGLYLCDSSGASLHEMAPGVQAPGFDFTAYIRWQGFRDLGIDLVLAELGHEPASAVIDAAKAELKSYFRDRARERGNEILQMWKDENSYPYSAEQEPSTQVERAERELFDIVAVAAAPAVEDSDLKSRRFSLRLLKEAIEANPSNVHKVVQEVLDLPPSQLRELSELIEKTSLGSIISAAKKITSRLDFLAGLERLVFDRNISPNVLERRQLHRILAAETWVFREEYALTADDATLKTALREHIRLLGRDGLTPSEVDGAEVMDDDDRRVVVDLMLSDAMIGRVVEQRENRRENIVIELKRPSVHIGMEEFNQISKYAFAVMSDARFAHTDCKWEFWIVGDKLEPIIEQKARQKDREPGVIDYFENGGVIRAVTWAKIIQDARHRLKFVQESLNYQSNEDNGLGYLRQVHNNYLPRQARASAVQSAS